MDEPDNSPFLFVAKLLSKVVGEDALVLISIGMLTTLAIACVVGFVVVFYGTFVTGEMPALLGCAWLVGLAYFGYAGANAARHIWNLRE